MEVTRKAIKQYDRWWKSQRDDLNMRMYPIYMGAFIAGWNARSAIAGQSTSKRKAKASRENGKLGGRPKGK